MPGILRIILLLTSSRVFASGHLQPPKEIQLSVLNIGMISLSWKPCPEENATADRKYRVEVNAPDYYKKYYTSSCQTQHSLSLHRGVSAKVATAILKNYAESSSSESILAVLPPSSGDDGTAATNLSCHINTEESLNVSLTCSWMTGEKAPLDTKYSMYYRYGKTAEQCLQYVSEEDGQRHIGCRVPSSNINLLEPQQKITVLINGSSRTRDIRSIDHEYNIFEIEVLNVPRNVTLQKKNGSQTLVWTNPRSVYSNICFKYEVRIWNLWNNEDKIEEALEPKLENGPLQEPWKKHVFQVRAVTKILCMDNVLYSAWTEPLYIDTVSSNIYVVAACVCLIVVLLVFMHICLRYQFCGQMFPPVPKPKNDLKEIFLNVPPAPDFLVGERWDSWGGSVIISSIEVVCDSEKCINPPVPAGDVHRPPF